MRTPTLRDEATTPKPSRAARLASARTALRDAYILACEMKLAPQRATISQLRRLEQLLASAERLGIRPPEPWARTFAAAINAFEAEHTPAIVSDLAPTIPLETDLADQDRVLEWLVTDARCGSFRPSLVAASLDSIIDRARFLRQQ